MSEWNEAVSSVTALMGEVSGNLERKVEATSSLKGTVGTLAQDGKVNVSFGGGQAIPCTPAVKCHIGDRVIVEVVGNVATVTHNLTKQAATEEETQEALDRAEQAGEAADAASASAAEAQSSADDAMEAASEASSAAAEADRKAVAAGTAANEAAQAASRAQSSADAAAGSASDALASASRANTHADDALVQLSIVQDVAGTLEWISDHGSFSLTQDQAVQEGKVYFTYDSTTQDYTPVVEPKDSDIATYYELSVTDSQTGYIMSHLAVTSRGLWVLPGGKGSSTTPASGESQDDSDARQGSGYKTLNASDGMYVYDGTGALVVKYGTSIDLGSGRPFSIGSEDAYILYYDSDDDGIADSIRIGGSKVTFGSNKTLTQLLADISNANANASSAVQTANDVPIVTLSSTNGTVFKRNTGVSTTIIATIFTPGGRIDDATELHRRFGNGAYLEWGWRDVVTDAYHALVSSDSRIGNNGFSLTVDPDDIDTQAVITCSLNY